MRGSPLVLVWLTFALAGCQGRRDEGLVARGTVEVPEVDLAPPVAARVLVIRVEEGAEVAPGDTVALLTQADLPASVAAGRARVSAAAAGLRDLEVGARPEEIERAKAELAGATAEAQRTAADLERFKALFSRDVIAKQQLDNASTAAAVAAERRRAAAEALAMLEAGSRRDRIAGARADLATAQASLGMIEARATDLVIRAPVAGRILTRPAEPGEFIGPGIPILTLGDFSRPYVRVYVSAVQVASLKIGDTASITLDGATGPIGSARVAAINGKAEFTPRVALTEQERADLMFGVKLELTGAAKEIHPGLWVTARFVAGR